MSVLEPRELEASPLADLHALAAELGIEGYRRLRKDQLIEEILAAGGGAPAGAPSEPSEAPDVGRGEAGGEPVEPQDAGEAGAPEQPEAPAAEAPEEPEGEVRTGTLDILPNGSGFVRADAFAHSPEDVYVSPGQIKRCELRTADEVSGPVRPPRRSERYPSLVRVETVNGRPAEPPPDRPSFDDLTATFARERLAAPEELVAVPFGKGSRVSIGGPPGAGATTMLRRVARTLADNHPEVELTVLLAGARPEELAEWRAEVSAPVVGGSFDEPSERQGEIASMAVERAKRVAEAGGHAAILVDALDFLPGHAARRTFGAARNTEDAGSITVVAATGLAPEPARRATTRIVLAPPAGAGAGPVVAGEASGTLRAELLE